MKQSTLIRFDFAFVLSLIVAVSVTSPLLAQIKSPRERLVELEERLQVVADLEKRVDELETKLKKLQEEQELPEGFLTIGNERFRLAGKVEFLFIDSEMERNPAVGLTDEPDPHLEIDVFRLYPRIDLNDEIRVTGQIDFKPSKGRVNLKEITARHRADPVWWFRSNFKLGLDDRFIRMTRDTENYPLVGNAFWRDESVAVWWSGRFGDKDGPPGHGDDSDADSTADLDFRQNWGELRTHISVSNGYTLDGNEVGFDRADFNDIVQDDREVEDNLSLREVGLGLEYARNFRSLGEISCLAFYYDDELNSDSVDFLQNELTLRDFAGVATAGYGDSNSTKSQRYGFGGEYFLPAETLYGRWVKTRAGDGMRLSGQWIEGEDGELRRTGWYVQASLRYSFPKRLLFDRYIRSVTPLVRFGELETNVTPDPALPGTWDREELLLGVITDITNDIFLKVEYTFHDEDPGAGGPADVDNNEFMIELQIRF